MRLLKEFLIYLIIVLPIFYIVYRLMLNLLIRRKRRKKPRKSFNIKSSDKNNKCINIMNISQIIENFEYELIKYCCDNRYKRINIRDFKLDLLVNVKIKIIKPLKGFTLGKEYQINKNARNRLFPIIVHNDENKMCVFQTNDSHIEILGSSRIGLNKTPAAKHYF